MRENVGVGGEGHQQSSDHIHTSKCGQDAFTQVCVRTQELKNWRDVTEEVVDLLRSTVGKAQGIDGLKQPIHQAKEPRSCHHEPADTAAHDHRVPQWVADGHIAIIGHESQQEALIPQEGEEEEDDLEAKLRSRVKNM